MEQSRLMVNVLHLYRTLIGPPELPRLPGIVLRHFAGPSDIDAWLEIRHRAFAREKVGVRQWAAADFEAEFLSKPWWKPERLWFAEPAPGPAELTSPAPIGTITLAFRGSGAEAQPVIHWLAVLPSWRRRGVARLLLAALEQTCWEAGYREVGLETHAGWQAALQFYERARYTPRQPE